LYVFGGLSAEGGWLNDLHAYDLKTNSWTFDINPTSESAPAPRDKHSCCAVGKKIYVFGGFGPHLPEDDEEEEEDAAEEEQNEGATFGWYNDMSVFDTETNTWSSIEATGSVPLPRAAFGGMSLVGTNIYVFGGRDNAQRTNSLFVFDTLSNSWIVPITAGVKPAPRSFHTATVIGSKIVIFGGLSRDNKHFNDLHVFDTATSCWMQPQVDGTVGERGFHSATLVDSELYIFGGSYDFNPELQECKNILNDLLVVDTASIQHGKSQATMGQSVVQ